MLGQQVLGRDGLGMGRVWALGRWFVGVGLERKGRVEGEGLGALMILAPAEFHGHKIGSLRVAWIHSALLVSRAALLW